jgi:hypothetical protein
MLNPLTLGAIPATIGTGLVTDNQQDASAIAWMGL